MDHEKIKNQNLSYEKHFALNFPKKNQMKPISVNICKFKLKGN